MRVYLPRVKSLTRTFCVDGKQASNQLVRIYLCKCYRFLSGSNMKSDYVLLWAQVPHRPLGHRLRFPALNAFLAAKRPPPYDAAVLLDTDRTRVPARSIVPGHMLRFRDTTLHRCGILCAGAHCTLHTAGPTPPGRDARARRPQVFHPRVRHTRARARDARPSSRPHSICVPFMTTRLLAWISACECSELSVGPRFPCTGACSRWSGLSSSPESHTTSSRRGSYAARLSTVGPAWRYRMCL